MLRGLRWPLVGVSVLTILGLACGSAAAPTATPAAATKPAATQAAAAPTAAAQATATKAAAPATTAAAATTAPAPTGPRGRIVIAVGDDPPTLDVTKSRAGQDYFFWKNTNEMLIQRDKDNVAVPGLATAWKSSPDGLQFDFTLRPNVKFHTGDVMGADDVVFSYARLRDPKISPFASANYGKVADVQAIDPRTVRVTQKSLDAVFVTSDARAHVVSKKYWEKVGEETFSDKPVGTGPYKYVDRKIQQGWTVEANTDWWGGPLSVKTAEFRVVSDEFTRVAMLKTAEADLIVSVPPPQLEPVEKTAGLKLLRYPSNYGVRIVLNHVKEGSPLANVKVRQALNYAIDRETIVSKLLLGMGSVHYGLMPGQLGFDPSMKPYPYDPAKAKQLLAEAGYKDGFTMDFWGLLSGRLPFTKEVGEAVVGYWNAVGVKTNVQNQEFTAYVTRLRRDQPPDVTDAGFMLASLTGATDPANSMNIFITCSGLYSYVCDKRIDDLVSQNLQEPDLAKREQQIKEAVRLLVDQAYTVELYADRTAFGINDRHIEFTPRLGLAVTYVEVKNIRLK